MNFGVLFPKKLTDEQLNYLAQVLEGKLSELESEKIRCEADLKTVKDERKRRFKSITKGLT